MTSYTRRESYGIFMTLELSVPYVYVNTYLQMTWHIAVPGHQQAQCWLVINDSASFKDWITFFDTADEISQNLVAFQVSICVINITMENCYPASTNFNHKRKTLWKIIWIISTPNILILTCGYKVFGWYVWNIHFVRTNRPNISLWLTMAQWITHESSFCSSISVVEPRRRWVYFTIENNVYKTTII